MPRRATGEHARKPRPAARRDQRSRGQALTEFALLAPAMLLLMLLAVDFGRLFFSYIAVNNAVREATYYAADHAADSDFDQDDFEVAIAQAGGREANMQFQGGEGTLTVSTPRCFNPLTGDAVSTPPPIACNVAAGFAAGIGNHVSVSVEEPFTFITPLIGDIFGGQLVLRASATAPVLNPLDASILPGPSQAPVPTPTPTEAPTPTPTPTPTATPTLPPGATPAPTPAPTPTPTPTPVPTCTVPDYKKGFWNNTGGFPALTVWANAGFTGTLTNLAGSNEIKTQSIHKGSGVPCTSNMSVDD